MLIGFFGGAAGIFAIASKSKGNVIPGVAIATALMPPLCTVGYGLATFQMHYFLGALYLFLINSIYIGLATFIGVKLMHFQRTPTSVPERAKRMRHIVYTTAILTLLPSIYLTYNMLRMENFQQEASRFVADEFQFPQTQVLSHTATYRKGERTVNVTLIGKALPQDSLELAMSAKLQYYGLQGAKLNIMQGDYALGASQTPGHSVKEIYEMAQTSLTRQQQEIDSLRDVIAMRRENDSISARLAPELKVIFPQVAEIAVTRAVFGNIATGSLDTANIALVHYSRPLPAASQSELSRYLAARLRVKTVKLVTVPATVAAKPAK